MGGGKKPSRPKHGPQDPGILSIQKLLGVNNPFTNFSTSVNPARAALKHANRRAGSLLKKGTVPFFNRLLILLGYSRAGTDNIPFAVRAHEVAVGNLCAGHVCTDDDIDTVMVLPQRTHMQPAKIARLTENVQNALANQSTKRLALVHAHAFMLFLLFGVGHRVLQ